MTLNEYDQYIEVILTGYSVSRILLDYELGFLLLGPQNQSFKITLDNDFVFLSGGKKHCLSPLDMMHITPVISVLHKEIAKLQAFRNGVLIVWFANGDRIEVQPDTRFEAWNIANLDGLLIVCMPDGDLAIWLPSDPENGSED